MSASVECTYRLSLISRHAIDKDLKVFADVEECDSGLASFWGCQGDGGQRCGRRRGGGAAAARGPDPRGERARRRMQRPPAVPHRPRKPRAATLLPTWMDILRLRLCAAPGTVLQAAAPPSSAADPLLLCLGDSLSVRFLPHVYTPTPTPSLGDIPERLPYYKIHHY